MKRKLFSILTLLVLASVLLSACGAAPAEKVKVVIFVGMGTGTDPDQVDAQNQLAQNSTPRTITSRSSS